MIKNLLSLVVLLLITTTIFAQQTVKDTVFIKRDLGEVVIDTLYIDGGQSTPQVLVGTRFLPYSSKIIGLMNSGLQPKLLKKVNACESLNGKPNYKDYPKINSIQEDKNTITIDIKILSNCCNNFLGEAEILKNNTLNLIFHDYGGFCSCSCCYDLIYTFYKTDKTKNDMLKFIKINGEKKLFPINDYK